MTKTKEVHDFSFFFFFFFFLWVNFILELKVNFIVLWYQW